MSIGLLTWVGGQEAERRAAIWGTVRRHLRLQTALWGCAFVVILGWRWQTTRPDGLLQVVFFELTEGSAALIQSPTGRQILVDGGRYPSELAQRLGEHLPFGDRTLDLVIVTGLDNGRLGGLPALFGRYEVGEIWVPGEPPARNDTWGALLAAAETSGTPVRDIVEEEAVVVGDGLRLAVAGVNEGAAGLALTFGDFMLATGRGEGWLAAEVVEVDSRVPPEALLSFRPRLSSSTLGTIQVRTDGRRMWWIAYR